MSKIRKCNLPANLFFNVTQHKTSLAFALSPFSLALQPHTRLHYVRSGGAQDRIRNGLGVWGPVPIPRLVGLVSLSSF